MSSKVEKINEIEKTLECLRLWWHKISGSENSLSPKKYALIPVEIIRVVVHVVKKKLERSVLTEFPC